MDDVGDEFNAWAEEGNSSNADGTSGGLYSGRRIVAQPLPPGGDPVATTGGRARAQKLSRCQI